MKRLNSENIEMLRNDTGMSLVEASRLLGIQDVITELTTIRERNNPQEMLEALFDLQYRALEIELSVLQRHLPDDWKI